jgi:hypothetical protein
MKDAFQREINSISRHKYCTLINIFRRFKACIVAAGQHFETLQ